VTIISGAVGVGASGYGTTTSGYPASVHDGISFNAASGRVIVKAPGASPTVGTLTSLFTFTGGNQSLYRGSGGLLIPSVTNTPRIEYGPGGDVYGLLMEASRTNQILQSRDFTNAAWVKTTMTAAKDQTGIDGTANGASSLTATAGNATALQTIVQAAVNSTFSVDIQRITGTGTIAITQDGAAFTDVTAQIVSTGYTRVTLTASQLNPQLGIRLGTNGDKIAVDTSQFEAGAFASSRIPTTTVSVARTADQCRRGTLGSEFSATAGTVVFSGRASGGQDAGLNQISYSFDDGTNTNRFTFLRVAGADTARLIVTTASVTQAQLDHSSLVNSTSFKHAAAWAVNDFASSFNGSAVQTDAAGTLPTVAQLGLGELGASQMNGHIRTFDYWPVRYDNATLQIRST